MTAPKQYVASHPLSIVTSVSLSNDHRVFIGQPTELSDEDVELLKKEFPKVGLQSAEDAQAAADAEAADDESPEGAADATAETQTGTGAAKRTGGGKTTQTGTGGAS